MAKSRFPALPEGYFWRVGEKEGWSDEGFGSWDGFGVSLMHGKKRIYRSTVIPFARETTIIHAAEHLWDRWDEVNREQAERKRLSGDYPPRSL